MVDAAAYARRRGAVAEYAEVIRRWSTPQSPALITAKVFTINCVGDKVPSKYRYKVITTTPEGYQEFRDLRNLEDFRNGCCPPQLAAAMFGDLEGAD